MTENRTYSVSDEERNETLPFVAEGDLKAAVAEALSLIMSFGQIDGSHHKAWTIDQGVRKLTGESYSAFVDSHDLGTIEGIDLADPAQVKRAREIGEGEYYDGDYTDEEISQVENGYYGWYEGVGP